MPTISLAGERYEIKFTETAIDLIRTINDARIKKHIRVQIDRLETRPEEQGKPLKGDLQGLFSIRVRRRWRVIYAVDQAERVVTIWAAGIRKEGDRSDIYRVINRIISRLGLGP